MSGNYNMFVLIFGFFLERGISFVPYSAFPVNSDIKHLKGDVSSSAIQLVPVSIASTKSSSRATNEVNYALVLTSEQYGEENKKKKILAARILGWFLKGLVQSRSKSHKGLNVNVLSYSNRDFFKGKIDLIELNFDKITYGVVQVSGGGKLVVAGVDLRLRRFFFHQDLHFIRKPYEISTDVILTQYDIVNSKLIRDLIQMLVDFLLLKTFFDLKSKVIIKRVTIKSRRIYVAGEADLFSVGSAVPFEVSAGAGVRGNKQVVFLKELQVVVYPDSNVRRATVPVLLTTPIDVDLGEDFFIENLVLEKQHIWIKARSIISPVNPFAVSPVAQRALCRYDLAAFLSQLLRFKGGLIKVPRFIQAIPNLFNRKNKKEEVSQNI